MVCGEPIRHYHLSHIAVLDENHKSVIESDMIESVVHYLKREESDIQYAGAALITTLSTVSPKIVEHIVAKGAINYLTLIVMEGGADRVQVVAAKALYTLAKRAPFVRGRILQSTISPLLSKLSTGTTMVIKMLFPPQEPLSPVSPSVMSPLSPRDKILDHFDQSAKECEGLNPYLSQLKSPEMAVRSPSKRNSNFSVVGYLSHCKSLAALLECLTVLLGGHRSFHRIVNKDGSESGIETFIGEAKMMDLASATMDLLILPLIKESESDDEEVYTHIHEEDLVSKSRTVKQDVLDDNEFGGIFSPTRVKFDIEESDDAWMAEPSRGGNDLTSPDTAGSEVLDHELSIKTQVENAKTDLSRKALEFLAIIFRYSTYDEIHSFLLGSRF